MGFAIEQFGAEVKLCLAGWGCWGFGAPCLGVGAFVDHVCWMPLFLNTLNPKT